MEIVYRKLSEMKKLDGNPRKITPEQMFTLKESIQKNRDYFEARPLILSDRTGDFYGQEYPNVMRWKVMNTTFYLMPYVYRGERGVQDDDTSLFAGCYNEGLFTGSLATGLVLGQTLSATAKGGLTDLYNECKLLNKALVTPIQFPSAILAERQPMNGNRIHHKISKRYLIPCVIRNEGGRSNIAWDTYPEDIPFTNEPKRTFKLREEEWDERRTIQ